MAAVPEGERFGGDGSLRGTDRAWLPVLQLRESHVSSSRIAVRSVSFRLSSGEDVMNLTLPLLLVCMRNAACCRSLSMLAHLPKLYSIAWQRIGTRSTSSMRIVCSVMGIATSRQVASRKSSSSEPRRSL